MGFTTPPWIRVGFLNLLILALAGPARANPVDLGLAGKYTVLAEGTRPVTSSFGGFVNLGVEAHIFGSIGGASRVELSSSVIVDDDIDYGVEGISEGASATYGSKNLLSPAEWQVIRDDLQHASDEALAYNGQNIPGVVQSTVYNNPSDAECNASVCSLRFGTTFTSLGAPLSVYHIKGRISLPSGDTLTIDGGPDDKFIINVTGTFPNGGIYLSSGADIVVSGGVKACNVVFNFTDGGHGASIGDIGASTMDGVYISPKMVWKLGDGAILEQTKFLADGFDGNVQDVRPPDPCDESAPPALPTPDPDPASTPEPTPDPTPTPEPTPDPTPTPEPTPDPTPTPEPTPDPTPTPFRTPLGAGMHPDKSKMKFGRNPAALDYLLVQAAFTSAQWDPAVCDFTLSIENANGQVTALNVPAGDLKQGRKCAIYSDRSARRSGGVKRLQICRMQEANRYRFNLKGFDAFAAAATLAEMSIQVDICGTPLPPHTDSWRPQRRGWLLPRSTWMSP